MESEASGGVQVFAVKGTEQRCPHIVIENFIGGEFAEQMLGYAEEQRGAFKPATVYNRESREERLNLESRNCLRVEGAGPFKARLKQAITAILPNATAALRILGERGKDLEFEMCAYGDGAFITPHIDTSVAAPRRIVSCVYYFFRDPPAGFRGGSLRLFGWPNPAAPAPQASIVEVVPQRDSLAIFPSTLRHEVMPVICPSGNWRDYRFSVNCWAHRRAD
jgi:SM-20-related protein